MVLTPWNTVLCHSSIPALSSPYPSTKPIPSPCLNQDRISPITKHTFIFRKSVCVHKSHELEIHYKIANLGLDLWGTKTKTQVKNEFIFTHGF